MNLPPPFVPDETILPGVGASAGIAIGPAKVFTHQKLRIPDYCLASLELAKGEVKRLEKARDEVRRKLADSKAELPSELMSQAGIIDAHLLLLDDPMLNQRAVSYIMEQRRNAEQAVIYSMETVSVLLRQVRDDYISSRLNDVEMVAQALIRTLLGQTGDELPNPPEGCILVVQDISPAELSKLASAKIAGLVTASGGLTSHTAIVSQAMRLPAVLGVKGLWENINDGDIIIIDGRAGCVIVRPDSDALSFYRTRQRMELSFNAEIVRSAHMPALTLDEVKINVLGNLELLEELPAVLSYGSEGIGLYRTEFMYLNRRSLPSEDELYESYRRVVESIAPRPVVIRTLDLGYDKSLESRPGVRTAERFSLERDKQALGLRGIRHCLRNRQLFKTQLRAILRAAVHGDVKIMLPMISSLDELRQAKAIVAQVEKQLRAQKRPFVQGLPLGIMMEVPGTVFIARELAEEAAFFSVGTNDLIQYSLAVDRANPEISDLYQPFHPAILRMLKLIIEAGRQSETPVSICGDMAAGELSAPIILGLGAEILSMPPAAVPKIKRLIRMSYLSEFKAWAAEALDSRTAAEAQAKTRRHMCEKFPELYR